MNGAEGNSGFGWVLVIVGLVIAAIGLNGNWHFSVLVQWIG